MNTNLPGKISYGLLLIFILTIPVDNYATAIVNIIVLLFGGLSVTNIILSGKWNLNKLQLWILLVLTYTLAISIILYPIATL